ncbi:MAG: hypothetical protein KKC19_01945, partial [Nanoarchaeota archaeon]|nr:hypothetical protein [Nanoarchaeota archaeon]
KEGLIRGTLVSEISLEPNLKEGLIRGTLVSEISLEPNLKEGLIRGTFGSLYITINFIYLSLYLDLNSI